MKKYMKAENNLMIEKNLSISLSLRYLGIIVIGMMIYKTIRNLFI